MKVVKAQKKIKRLQGDVNDLQNRIQSSLSALEENGFEEKYEDLKKVLDEKVKELMTLKVAVMRTNIKHGMFQVVVNLGELKNRIDFLRGLNPQSGVVQGRMFGQTDKTVYKTQVTAAQKTAMIEECQTKINELTDKLDDFNGSTDIEEVEVAVQGL